MTDIPKAITPAVALDTGPTIELSKINPANALPIHEQIVSGLRKRVSISNGRRKLEAPKIPGYNLYWFLERNVLAAQEGGYEFVEAKETVLNQHGLANASETSGNTDLGTRVSVSTTGPDGGERLYLMKIRLEWYNEDRQAIHEKNTTILRQIFRDEFIFDPNSGQGSPGHLNRDPNVYFNESNQFQGNTGQKALFNRRRRAV